MYLIVSAAAQPGRKKKTRTRGLWSVRLSDLPFVAKKRRRRFFDFDFLAPGCCRQNQIRVETEEEKVVPHTS
jgi:hypothetical protein